MKASLRNTYFALHLLAMCMFLQGLSFKKNEQAAFENYMESFHRGYQALGIANFEFDYKENFAHIVSKERLEEQKAFFTLAEAKVKSFDRNKLSSLNRLHYDHIVYQAGLNKQRIALESAFVDAAREPLPGNGLSSLDKNWYRYYTRFYTSVDMAPEALFAFGEKEIARVQNEIGKIRSEMGYAHDSAGFYRHINSNALLLSSKDSILNRYAKIKNTVYKNLGKLFEDTRAEEILLMEWVGAGKYTPPGYYSPAHDNAFGKGVYYFNFYNGLHNTRAMDWLFIHEGVPGHHYQWVIKNRIAKRPAFISNFYYPGNFEGWGAYAEYLGKELGLYQTPVACYGKWEWDLVRSVRILIDVGIHHYGWTEKKALDCWRKYIPNQDDIAEREVKRCMNWPAQALSYKVGADRIRQMREKLEKQDKEFSLKRFHSAYLEMGSAPVEVMEKNIEGFYFKK